MEKSEQVSDAEAITNPYPPPYKLLLKCPFGLSPSQVFVDFSSTHDRIPHSDLNLEESILEIWDQRLQQKPSLFNGTKFRYGGHAVHDMDDPNQHTVVSLNLGLTDYRTFVGTNLSSSWEKFLVPSEDDSKRCQHTSNPLGNGAVVETADRNILVLQRSHNVGEFPGYFVFPGGHPEPGEVGISSHQHEGSMSESAVINRKVSQEMFDSIIREVVEEIGVPASSLSNAVLIGISQRGLNVRPTAFFHMKCNLESKEIHQLYSSAQDGYESTQLYTVSRSELEKMAAKMPGCHWGGFALYDLVSKTVKDI
ncbi:nudix hydrolase 9-like [Papaver somniferum]|uniref:nudix hydrolase 9-like n=1 Tax=Papaver somniferum TaxID=3469 RepID=UPI000E6FC6C0|nr:nudix hydrolase 9-like [Papaver somniferum]